MQTPGQAKAHATAHATAHITPHAPPHTAPPKKGIASYLSMPKMPSMPSIPGFGGKSNPQKPNGHKYEIFFIKKRFQINNIFLLSTVAASWEKFLDFQNFEALPLVMLIS